MTNVAQVVEEVVEEFRQDLREQNKTIQTLTENADIKGQIWQEATEDKEDKKAIWEDARKQLDAAAKIKKLIVKALKTALEKLPSSGNDVLERLQTVEAALGASRGLFTTVFRFLPSASSSTEPQQAKRKNCRDEREAFREAVFGHYNAWEDGANIKLHFPEVIVPKAHACAAHILARRWGPHMPEHLDLEDINSPTNALVLVKPIKMAFDRGQLTFLYDAERNGLFMKLLDDSIASTAMADASASYSYDPKSHIPDLPEAVAAMTFEDYDGLPLTFPNFAPAKRCPELHARLAVLNAEREGWIGEGDIEIASYGSEAECKERLKLLLGKMQD